MSDKDKSWFLRRHDYRPEAIGMTEPDEPGEVIVPPSGALQGEQLAARLIDIIDNKLNLTNSLLEDLVEMQYHNQITDEDIDVSDSVTYSLATSEAAIVSYKIPDDYVLLLREFNMFQTWNFLVWDCQLNLG
jgi:hypothetical protein